MVNAMGPYNLRREPIEEKIARIDDIGGPDTHSNFPLGWAMASNTPLRRYKQNTHGGGIRDPLVISWPKGIAARGELRHQFCHASDLAPTLLDVVGITPPATINGVAQMPLEGTSFAPSLNDPKAPSKAAPQYFEMFGHRGLVKDGWKAVAFHPLGSDFDQDKWELFHLDRDFSETDDLAEKEPERLKALIDAWWKRGRGAQGAAARRPLRAALRRQRQALPRAAQAIRLPCRHGPCADRRRARRAQPHLHDRGRRADRRRHDRGRADRPWRHDLRLLALHQGQPADLRHERRRRSTTSPSRTGRCRRAIAGSACACGATRAATSRPC